MMTSKAATVSVGRQKLSLTRLNKVLYPEAGFTKAHIIDYYMRAAPVLLPHLKDRPLTLKRYPDGVEGSFFFEKRAPRHRPKWVKTAPVPSRRDNSDIIHYCLANDLETLVWAANLADLELHVFLARHQEIDRPTQMVFDLDPGEGADARDCAEIALRIRDLLGRLKLESFIKSSGSKGLHLHVPLNTKVSYAETKPFAKAVALAVESVCPEKVVSDMKKALRRGKVLIDWSQNDRSKTTVCAYSLRAKARPFVAAPLAWDEVEAFHRKGGRELVFFEAEEALRRIEKAGDLFEPLLSMKQELPRGKAGLASAAKEAAAGSGRKRASRAGGGALTPYQAKRRFDSTTEPAGDGERGAAGGGEGLFVIQKHDARRLHYDFRLAMGGVLKSWAVPKGVPAAAGEKHLAVEVEDHPMEYARFEGIIPEGNYGAGTVMVWDIGAYKVLGGEPLDAWRKGKLHLELQGKKLHGEWTLVRMRHARSDKNEWLLLKTGGGIRLAKKAMDTSALSGRTMARIAREKDAQWESDRDRPAAQSTRGAKAERDGHDRKILRPLSGAGARRLMKKFVEPMKCRLQEDLPQGEVWIYELKLDGYRAVAVCEGESVLLASRNRKSFNERFPAIVEAVAGLGLKDAVLDGELVALDENDRPSFQLLQNAEEGPRIAYYLFDLLALEGRDWTGRPLAERKERLRELLRSAEAPLFFSANLSGAPEAIWRGVRKHGFEGVIAKRADSVYEPGLRSGAWVKVKAVNEQEFVIGGYSKPKGSRPHFGALLIGVYKGEQLAFCGKVGTGFSAKTLASVHRQLEKLKTAECPFANLPSPKRDRWGGGITRAEMKSCTWVEPKLVGTVRFTEWTSEGLLRHPAFVALREDIAPRSVRREAPAD